MKTPNLGLVFLIVILTAVFAVFITVMDGLRILMRRVGFLPQSSQRALSEKGF